MKSLSPKFKNLKQKRSPRRRKIFKHDKAEDRFTAIYNNNYWRSDESISGSGSTLDYTENLREKTACPVWKTPNKTSA